MITRRQFLKGSGGFLFSLPLLPSLLSPSEAAAACVGTPPKRLITFFFRYGNSALNRFCPDKNQLSFTQAALPNGKIIGHAPIPQAGSSIFQSAYFNGNVLSKANFYEGVDIPLRIAHANSTCFGPYVNPYDLHPNAVYHDSLDQVVAQELGSGFPIPAFHYGTDSGGSTSFVVNNQGAVQQLPGFTSAQQAYSSLFGSGQPIPGIPLNTPILNQVFEDYQRLRGNSRLSSADRSTLDQVMTRISDLENRIAANAGCDELTPPGHINTWGNFANQVVDWDNYTDVMVAAFQCCLSNVATVNFSRYSHTGGFDWHDWSHSDDQLSSQNGITGIFQGYTRDFIAQLVNKMNSVIEGNGLTMLDNSLVIVGEENSGVSDHSNRGMKFATFGSLGGTLRTGRYYDFTDSASPLVLGSQFGGAPVRPGIAAPQFFWTLLKAFGLTDQQINNHLPTSHPQHSRGGFGHFYIPPNLGYTEGPDMYGNVPSTNSSVGAYYPQNLSQLITPMLVNP